MREVGNPEKLDSAIYLLNRAIETDDNFALAYADLGRAYWNKYRFVKDSAWVNSAEENCRQAIQINPNCAKAHNTLGNIYSEFRNFDKAIDQFESALNINSSDTMAYRGLARVFEMQNNPQEAESIYKKAISIRPDYPRAYFDLAWFYIKHARMQDARLLTQKILSLNPRGFKDLNNLGALYYYLGKYERANEIWDQSLQVQPNYGAYSNLGALYFNQSRYEDAAGMYEKALSINDSDYRVWMNLAGAYDRMQSDKNSDSSAYMKAIQMAEIQKSVNPDDPVVLSHLAEAYAAMQMHDKAIDHIERALLIEPDNVNYYVSAGFVYESAKMREEAVTWIKKALENGVPAQRIKNVPEFDSLISDPAISEYIIAEENNAEK
ncbi:MAG: tetratricopeptide repeat protein [candidate division Zixibacteria bacterium]|nr:tetratricopeptide repeat protein [candidate division Zixibacteria bacterium]